MLGQDVAKREGSIGRTLSEMHAAMEALAKTVDRMEERITLILAPTGANKAPCKPEPANPQAVPLASDIDTLSAIARRANDHLCTLIDRVEL